MYTHSDEESSFLSFWGSAYKVDHEGQRTFHVRIMAFLCVEGMTRGAPIGNAYTWRRSYVQPFPQTWAFDHSKTLCCWCEIQNISVNLLPQMEDLNSLSNNPLERPRIHREMDVFATTALRRAPFHTGKHENPLLHLSSHIQMTFSLLKRTEASTWESLNIHSL